MRIGVIGCGVVGEATARVLEDNGHTVERHDPAKGHEALGHFDIAFICVPTPEGSDGLLDTSILEVAMAETDADLKVVRSTVPLGFMTEGVYMPCFAREALAYQDEHEQKMLVLGGPAEDVAKVTPYYKPAFCVSRYNTNHRTAEFIKLAMNSHLAMQISFASEMAEQAAKIGADWETVARALRRDKRIGQHAYLRPGPYGGACLPKDTKNLAVQTGSRVLQAVHEVNEEALCLVG